MKGDGSCPIGDYIRNRAKADRISARPRSAPTHESTEPILPMGLAIALAVREWAARWPEAEISDLRRPVLMDEAAAIPHKTLGVGWCVPLCEGAPPPCFAGRVFDP
jgi:hypothetical protein